MKAPRLTKLYDETIHGTSRIFIFIIYDDRVRLVSWNTPRRDFCNMRSIKVLFFLYRKKNFQAKLSIRVNEGNEWALRKELQKKDWNN